MARQQVITFTDDMTGRPVDRTEIQTVVVHVGRVSYELDVSSDSYTKHIAPLIAAGRRVNGGALATSMGRPPVTTAAPTKPDKSQNKAIREWWAKNQGRDGLPPVVERGRIPGDVIEAFQRHGGASIPVPATVPAKTAPAKVAPAASFSDKPTGKTVVAQRKPETAADVKVAPAARKQGTKTTPAKAPAKVTTPAASRARSKTKTA